MMEVSIEQLIEKLYQEGIQRAEQEAHDLLQAAREKAERIVREAEKRAQQIVQDAENQAKAIELKIQAELNLAAAATLSSLREKIRQELFQQAVVLPVRQDLLQDKNFLMQVILILVEKSTSDFVLKVPPDLAEKLQRYFEQSAGRILQHLEIVVEPGRSGFTIEAKNGGYALEFDEPALVNFFAQYLKPTTAALLKT
ncbi:MAG: hypothetical protein N2Z22_04240 [Turneriella sp.]|nr:hypothetical protein [Turneriella sp.]